MSDPLAGMDLGPDDVFYEPVQKPVIMSGDGQQQPQPSGFVYGQPGNTGDLAARVARLEEQVRRLVDLAGMG